MSLTITPKVYWQNFNNTTYKYAYLYEPFFISVSESDSTAKRLTVRLQAYDPTNGSLVHDKVDYAVYDLDDSNSIELDVMALIRQFENHDVYKIGYVMSMSWKLITAEFRYRVILDTDAAATTAVGGNIYPIRGGRMFREITGAPTQASPIDEFDLYNVDRILYEDFLFHGITLLDPNATPANPTIIELEPGADDTCTSVGILYWKSRLGGLCQFAFDIMEENINTNTIGDLASKNYETIDSRPAIVPNYSEVKATMEITLKSIGLPKGIIQVLRGIAHSPAIWYQSTPYGNMELMKLKGLSAPLNNLANGGNVELVLSRISYESQMTR